MLNPFPPVLSFFKCSTLTLQDSAQTNLPSEGLACPARVEKLPLPMLTEYCISIRILSPTAL